MLSLKPFTNIFKKRAGKIDKRIRFVITAILLTILITVGYLFPIDYALLFIPLLMIFSYILTYFCLLENIEGISWFGFFIMPIVISITLYLEYFLFPGRWLSRIPFIIVYGISIYAVLLTSNIFNVGVEKSLQLYRAAFSVNYFYHALVAFLGLNFFYSMRLNVFFNTFLTGAVTVLLAFHLLWTIRLNSYLEREIVKYALFIMFIIAQIAMVLSFVPLKPAVMALFVASSYYSLVGVVYHHIDQRLFKETIREYLFVWIFVAAITLLSISW